MIQFGKVSESSQKWGCDKSSYSKKTCTAPRRVPSHVSTSYKVISEHGTNSNKSSNATNSTKQSNCSSGFSGNNPTGSGVGRKATSNHIYPRYKTTNWAKKEMDSAKTPQQKLQVWKSRNDSSQMKQALAQSNFKPIFDKNRGCYMKPLNPVPQPRPLTVYRPPWIFHQCKTKLPKHPKAKAVRPCNYKRNLQAEHDQDGLLRYCDDVPRQERGTRKQMNPVQFLMSGKLRNAMLKSFQSNLISSGSSANYIEYSRPKNENIPDQSNACLHYSDYLWSRNPKVYSGHPDKQMSHTDIREQDRFEKPPSSEVDVSHRFQKIMERASKLVDSTASDTETNSVNLNIFGSPPTYVTDGENSEPL